MSLVRPASFYQSRELYSLKNGNKNNKPGASPSMCNSTTGNDIIYANESCASDNTYDPEFFLDSPSEDLVQHASVSDISSYQNRSVLDCFDDPRTPEDMNYDEDQMRLKFQEFERVLNSNDDDDHSPDMDIDVEWSKPTTHDPSSKETSTSDSNLSLSSISSINKEISCSNLTPKSLLFQCASAIDIGKFEEASQIIGLLRQRVSIEGEPFERIAAYMVEALAARIATSGKGLYKALKCKEQPLSDRLSAMQVLFEACPCFRFGFMAANGAILEAFKGEKRVHIIDFDINQGSQYYTLLQTLAKTPYEARPHVKLTGVDDPESVQRTVGGLKIIGQRLVHLAKDLNLSFEFNAVSSETALVSPLMLDIRPGEAIIVNFSFQLHHMPDESVSTVNLRDQLLRMVKGLNPKLVTHVEQDVNTNTAPFLARFNEAFDYYSAVFESLDATLQRDNQDRMNVEKHCLARDIINVVACEGEERIERYEVAGKWGARMRMAGFFPSPMSKTVDNEIRQLIKRYSDRYRVKEENGALHFGWEDKTLIVSSAWK